MSDSSPCSVELRTAVAAPPDAVHRLLREATGWPSVFAPTVHVEHLEAAAGEERLQVWSAGPGPLRRRTTRRRVDDRRRRIAFAQETTEHPVTEMTGTWAVKEMPTGSAHVVLVQTFRVVDDAPRALAWVRRAVERSGEQELADLREAAEDPGAPELVATFGRVLPSRVEPDDLRARLWDVGDWAHHVPHVATASVVDEPPDAHRLTVHAQGPDGSSHRGEWVRVLLPAGRIAFKELTPATPLRAHHGVWTVTGDGDGAQVRTVHTVRLDRAAVGRLEASGITGAHVAAQVRDTIESETAATIRGVGDRVRTPIR